MRSHLLGVIAHQVGKHEVAVEYIRRAIGLNGNAAAFHNNLGNALKEQGKLDEAVACYRRALELKPDFAEAHNNLGNALKDQGKLDEAVACYRRALELKPDFAEAHNNLGVALKDQGKLDEAVACCRRALELKPDFAEAHNNLGIAFKDQGKLDEAVACYRRALELKPDFAEAHNNLGIAFKDQGKLDEAVACCRRALELKPDFAEAHNNLGNALKDQGKLDEAVACYRRALELKPDFAEAHNNLGVAFKDQGKLDEAVACCRRALELKPDYAEAHNNLGVAFKDQGKLDEAVACYRRALELKPDFAEAHSNLVYAQLFCPGYDAQALYEEHRRWNQRHAAPLAKFIQPHRNDRSPDRRLRIGYVSPDFRNHCQAFFTVPLFSVARPRELRDRLLRRRACVPIASRSDCRGHADAWRNIAGLSRRAGRRADPPGRDRHPRGPDDAHGPQPPAGLRPQAGPRAGHAWLAYPGTTGLSTIDYRLTDPYLDPPGLDDRCYSEESIRLPDSFWCYDPLDSEPAVNALPAAEKGYVSFGCLNNFCKVNPARPEDLGAGAQGRRSLPADDPGRRRNASPARRWTCWPRKALAAIA